MAAQKHPEGTKLIADNRKAHFNYEVEDTLEAGLQLLGSEVKALREGKVNLGDGYALPTRAGEMVLHNVHIGAFKAANQFGHEPLRQRKLLMRRNEIDRWTSKATERGWAIIPLMLYFKDGRAKVQLGLCRGKNQADRRHSIKERETQREVDRELRRR